MKNTIILIITLISINTFSQNHIAEYNFTSNFKSTTARAMALSGSIGAIGSDLSSSEINPAGLGFLIKKDLNISSFAKNKKFNFDNSFNISYIHTSNIKIFNNFKMNFAFSVGRVANLNYSLTLNNTTTNLQKNFTNELLLNANKNSIITSLAKNVGYLTKTDNEYTTHLNIENNYSLLSSQYISSTGTVDHLNLSTSINNRHLYYGASINFTNIQQTIIQRYTEKDFESKNDNLKKFNTGEGIPYFNSIENNILTNRKAFGIDIKIGGIYNNSKYNFRIGVAIHSPKLFFTEDTYNNMLLYNVDVKMKGYKLKRESSKTYSNTYNRFTSPKLTVSLGKIIMNFLSINVDYEIVDFSNEKNWKNNNAENGIKDLNKTFQHSIRGGCELKFGFLFGRIGYAFSSSPYKKTIDQYNNTIETDRTVTNFSFGGGYRINKYWYIDIGYSKLDTKFNYDIDFDKITKKFDFSSSDNYLTFSLGRRF